MITRIPKSIDEYFVSFPTEIQKLLQQVRTALKKAAPDAEEAIKYAMPAFVYKGNLVFFAAYKKHIGFYPTPSGIIAFKKDLAAYQTSKGVVQFPLDKPMPVGLITKIVKYRVKENSEKAKAQAKKG